jgi:D-tyrosyl-tRNA(Tyr) deacylase
MSSRPWPLGELKMKALVQRVRHATVHVDRQPVAAIGPGLLVLLGVHADDAPAAAERLARKVLDLRIFEDGAGKMNDPLGEREILCVSQFTLYANARHGNRPSFSEAAPPERAQELYDRFCELTAAKRGVFGAHMQVGLLNDGPVTIMLEA